MDWGWPRKRLSEHRLMKWVPSRTGICSSISVNSGTFGQQSLSRLGLLLQWPTTVARLHHSHSITWMQGIKCTTSQLKSIHMQWASMACQ
eukprot:1975819-Amphidinium_carterae.1